MVELRFNGVAQEVVSVEQLGNALDQFDEVRDFELWCNASCGPSLCMLRSGHNAWLMYLRFNGDGGFSSVGDVTRSGAAFYVLSNGQVDEYPLSFCIDVEQCYKSVAYFFSTRA